jgi:hypothetical protein
MTMNIIDFARALTVCLALMGCMTVISAEEKAAGDGGKTAEGVIPYPLDYCATCGPEEEEKLVTKIHKGREIKMCKGCVKIFNADPDGYVQKVDKAIKEAEKAKGAEKPAK